MNKSAKFLIVKSNHEEYLIPLHYILYIEKLEYNDNYIDSRIKTIQNSPDFVLGVMFFKNKNFPIFEMELILNNEKTKLHNENKIIFIKLKDKEIGLMFNDVIEIKSITLSNEKISLNDSKPFKITDNTTDNYFVIDVEKIFSETSEYNYFDSQKN